MFGLKKVDVSLYNEGSMQFHTVRRDYPFSTLQRFSRKAAATPRGALASDFQITPDTPQAFDFYLLGKLLDYSQHSNRLGMGPFPLHQNLDTLAPMYIICYELEVPSQISGREAPCSATHLLDRIVKRMVSDRELPSPRLLALVIGFPLSKPVSTRLAQGLVTGELNDMVLLRNVVSRLPRLERTRFQDQVYQAVALRTSLAALHQMPVADFVVNTSWENWVRGTVPDNGFQQVWTPPIILPPSVLHQMNIPPPP